MTIKGYTQGYIVQYVVAELDGTVIDTFDDREEAEACACEGQQIVALDGYGYVAEITDAPGDLGGDEFDTDGTPFSFDDAPSPYTVQGLEAGQSAISPYTVADIEAAYGPLPRFPWSS